MASAEPIPEPRGYPVIGNLNEFSGGTPLQTLKRLAATYGPIYRLRIGSTPRVVISSHEFVNEAFDEKRFRKSVNGVLGQVRNGVHDALFTAKDDEPNWGKAHRVLTPAFGPMSIRGMFDEMYDIATQMSMKLARHGSHHPVNVSDDFTRLALDTLALCSMDYRFNSYYNEEMHPFIQAMGDFLSESGARSKRPAIVPDLFYWQADAKYAADINVLRKVADEVVQTRKQNPNDRKDLLGAMLRGVDPQTGEKLSDSNISDQLITFLIAGHETTSGLLSFAFYNLLKHPAAYQKVQEEVDRVVGRSPIKVEHMTKMPYIAGVLRETLRLCAPINAVSVEPIEDTLLCGKYLVHKGEVIVVLIANSMRDAAVYGDDADEFIPERMLDENFNRRNKEFPNAWKPFGNGKRACIGRPFAWQEAILAMAVLFQNFNFSLTDPNYQLQNKETLTVKPDNFFMQSTLRHGMTPTELEHRLAGDAIPDEKLKKSPVAKAAASGVNAKPLAIYYGSQSGTCEAMAQRVASDAAQHGFGATVVEPLDKAKQNLPKDQPVIIITASYEGQPPSNAAHFVNWIEGMKGNELEDVSYAVFGCGHHDWAQTFHRIPKLVDDEMQKAGATRLADFAGADAAEGDMFSDFEDWEDQKLWPALQAKYGTSDNADGATPGGLSVEVTAPRMSTLRQDVEEAVVVEARTLTQKDKSKWHVEIQLPTGMTYTAGDYLAVLPFNPRDTVSRVFRRFQLSWDASLKISASGPTTLPTNTEVSAADVLGAYVELSQPATKRNILALAEATEDQKVAQELQKLADDSYQHEISAKKVSVLELLDKYPAISLPFGSYLAMLPPMRVRQYSISSSPLVDPSKATITYSLLDQPALSGQGRHIGVATHFLSSLTPGEKLHVAVRPSATQFHLPRDAEATPVICIAAGAGLAPFRGFIQEREAMIVAGRSVAPALLFYGCRAPDADDLYAEEFARWEKIGAVEVRRAFSRATDESDGCKYVQHRVYHDRKDVLALWDRGARVYVCGTRGMGQAVEDVCVKLVQERAKENRAEDISEEQAREWIVQHRNERFATDVFD